MLVGEILVRRLARGILSLTTMPTFGGQSSWNSSGIIYAVPGTEIREVMIHEVTKKP